MKINASYISSKYDFEDTISLLSKTNIDAIHADIMDGIYAGSLNYQNKTFTTLMNSTKPKEFHLMVHEPEELLPSIIPLKPTCIYIHPDSTNKLFDIFNILDKHNIDKGLVINPSIKISDYLSLYPKVNRVLLMSVIPGSGGQEFIPSTTKRLEELLIYKNIYNFKIYVDGGINNDTIKLVKKADGVVVGSYICK